VRFWLWILTTFSVAWYALDRLAVAAPAPGPALLAAGVVFAILAIGLGVHGTPQQRILTELGLGRPRPRPVIAAAVAGGLVLATYVVGAVVLGVDLHLRANWLSVLGGTLLFHGIAEELVWRGFAFGQLRRRMRFWPAVAWSIPLITCTHIPIIASAGALVGGLAVISAAATCVPLSYLWEHDRRSIWAAALLHSTIGCWQLFYRDYPATFSVIVLLASIVAPQLVFIIGSRVFHGEAPSARVHLRDPSANPAG
jgi:membrane protease YdiL (CAAX protease family)